MTMGGGEDDDENFTEKAGGGGFAVQSYNFSVSIKVENHDEKSRLPENQRYF